MSWRSLRYGLAARVIMVFGLLTMTLGCQPSVRGIASEVPRAATPAFADSSLQVMEDQATRRRIAAVLATPEMQGAMRDVSAALVQGAALGLTDQQMAERLTPIMQRMTEAVAVTLREQLLSEEMIARSSRAATTIASNATRAAVAAAADEIPSTLAPVMERAITERLGPALEVVLRDNIARGTAAALERPEVRDGLGRSARALSREVVYGTNEALADLEAHQPKKGLLARMAGLVRGMGGFGVALLGLGVLAVALVAAWGVRQRRGSHEDRRERELNDAVLLALTTTMEAAEGKPWRAELQEAVRERIRRARAEDGRSRSARH